MSGSLPAGVILKPRLGPKTSQNRERTTVGSDQPIYIEIRDRITGALVGGVGGMSTWYWLPGAVAQDSPAQPLDMAEISPGVWSCLVAADLPGTYLVQASIEAPMRAACEIVFDATSLGNFHVSAGTIPYSVVQAVAAAAAVSAARAEMRLLVPVLAGEAGAEAGGAAGSASGALAGATAAGQVVGSLTARTSALEALTNYVAPTVTSFSASPAIVEIGTTVASVTLSLTRSRMDLPVQITGASTATIAAGQTSVTVTGAWTAAATWTATCSDPSPPPGRPSTATASTSLSFRSRRYWGLSSVALPPNADIIAMASELSVSGAARLTATLSPANQYVVYAQPAAWPIAATVKFGSTDTTAFTDTVRNLTNASGGVVSYRIRVLTFPLTATQEFTF